MEAYRIVRLDETNLRSVPETAQSFDVIGRLVPAYDGVKWTWTEEVFAQKTSKVYPAEAFAPSEYIENPKRVAFMAMRCGQCAGIIRADTRWNGNVQIEDFAVDQNHRRRGVGGMLMDALVRWGRSGGKTAFFLKRRITTSSLAGFICNMDFNSGARTPRFIWVRRMPKKPHCIFIWIFLWTVRDESGKTCLDVSKFVYFVYIYKYYKYF